jgi:hypothetical protein
MSLREWDRRAAAVGLVWDAPVANATTKGTRAPVGTHPRNPSSARVPHPAPERFEALDVIGGKVAPGIRPARPPRRTAATRRATRRALQPESQPATRRPMPKDSSTGKTACLTFSRLRLLLATSTSSRLAKMQRANLVIQDKSANPFTPSQCVIPRSDSRYNNFRDRRRALESLTALRCRPPPATCQARHATPVQPWVEIEYAGPDSDADPLICIDCGASFVPNYGRGLPGRGGLRLRCYVCSPSRLR